MFATPKAFAFGFKFMEQFGIVPLNVILLLAIKLVSLEDAVREVEQVKRESLSSAVTLTFMAVSSLVV